MEEDSFPSAKDAERKCSSKRVWAKRSVHMREKDVGQIGCN